MNRPRLVRGLRIACTLAIADALILACAARSASATGPFCVVPDRAVVVYENFVYVMEPGTDKITRRVYDDSYEKTVKMLPIGVRPMRRLNTSDAHGIKGTKALEAWMSEERDKKWKAEYLMATKDKRIS